MLKYRRKSNKNLTEKLTVPGKPFSRASSISSSVLRLPAIEKQNV